MAASLQTQRAGGGDEVKDGDVKARWTWWPACKPNVQAVEMKDLQGSCIARLA